jgi:2-dehydro-3-deoxy-D-arabinonate dehydratase
MQLCKVRQTTGEISVGVVQEGRVLFLRPGDSGQPNTLSDFLHVNDPAAHVLSRIVANNPNVPFDSAQLLPPLDEQEVWAAGVTYKRSREARERESAGAARFYDLVYNAERPELFLKATPRRVVGPGAAVRIRRDSRWNVPEPELALVVSPQMKIVGYTIGNDMSSRDIEGENPLYLPQAKVYDGSCSLGPVITTADTMPPPEQVTIRLTITRSGAVVFDGSTSLSAMKRSFEDLVSWLGRESSFPNGVILLTGTGIVPPDHFTLEHGDDIAIDITDIGTLRNVVRA